jgi:hypothetical protein
MQFIEEAKKRREELKREPTFRTSRGQFLGISVSALTNYYALASLSAYRYASPG